MVAFFLICEVAFEFAGLESTSHIEAWRLNSVLLLLALIYPVLRRLSFQFVIKPAQDCSC